MAYRDHKGDIFPDADKRKCAYESEPMRAGGLIRAQDSSQTGPHSFRPRREARDYEFTFYKHTDNALVVNLRIFRNDIVEQRIEKGFAVEYEDYQTTVDFGTLMNRIFGPGCEVFEHTEAFPESVREVMKVAYRK